jgi:hypothetical protein
MIGRTGSLPGPTGALAPASGIAGFVRLRWLAASAATWAVFAGLSYLSSLHRYFPFDVPLGAWVSKA